MENQHRTLPLNMNHITNSNYLTIIHSDLLKQETLDDIIKTVEDNYIRIKDFFNISIIVPIVIYVFSTQKEMHQFIAGKDMQNWVVGFGNKAGIKIVDPNLADKLGRTYNGIIQVVVHELTHVLNNLSAKVEWQIKVMREGIAAFMSNQHYIPGIKKWLNNLDLAAETLFNQDNSDDFAQNGGYQLSYTVIEYIIKKYGEEKLKEYFLSTEPAPFKILNIEPDDFINDWKNFLNETYGEAQ
jgi:hypothetical protein